MGLGTLVTLYCMVAVLVLILVIFRKIHWGWLVVVLVPPFLLLLLLGLLALLVGKSSPRINQREVDKVIPRTTTKFGVNPKIVDFTSGFRGMYNFTGSKGKKGK